MELSFRSNEEYSLEILPNHEGYPNQVQEKIEPDAGKVSFNIFEEYGLQMGENSAVFGLGALKLVGGGALMLHGLPFTASELVFSGASDIYSAMGTSKEVSLKGSVARTAADLAGGGMGKVAGKIVKMLANPYFNFIMTAVLSTTVEKTTSAVVSAATETVVSQEPVNLEGLAPENLMMKTVGGILTKGVAKGSEKVVNQVGEALFHPVSISATAAIEAAAGAAGHTTVKMTENWLEQLNFLQVMYEAIPEEHQIESGKLYLFIQNEEICFLSVHDQGQPVMTQIKADDQFLVASQDPETQICHLKAVLKSEGQQSLSNKQKQFILENAYQYQHRPVNLTKGIFEAAVVGAGGGAMTILTE